MRKRNLVLTSEALPKHIAVIMDGNGRWAKEKGKPRAFGHRSGVKAVRKTISTAAQLGIQAVTLFAFSSENWHRPKDEVGVLIELFFSVLHTEVKRLHRNNLRLKVIGDISRFSKQLQNSIAEAEALTVKNTGMVVNIAANYGGKWDITSAVREIAGKVACGELKEDDITEDSVGRHICMADLPEVDLLIRTSGEYRISNFLLWQLAYAELYFTPTYWPDFDEDSLVEAVVWFVNRERRFGCLSNKRKPSKNKEFPI